MDYGREVFQAADWGRRQTKDVPELAGAGDCPILNVYLPCAKAPGRYGEIEPFLLSPKGLACRLSLGNIVNHREYALIWRLFRPRRRQGQVSPECRAILAQNAD